MDTNKEQNPNPQENPGERMLAYAASRMELQPDALGCLRPAAQDPAQTAALRLLVHFLIGRWRTGDCAMPSWPALAALISDAPAPGRAVGARLAALAEHALELLNRAQRAGERIEVRDPLCDDGNPASLRIDGSMALRLLIEEMEFLRSRLRTVLGAQSLSRRAKALEEMLGEDVAQRAVGEIAHEAEGLNVCAGGAGARPAAL